MRRLRHLAILSRDMVSFSSDVGALWLVPLVALILLTAVLALTAHATVPYVVYTFF